MHLASLKSGLVRIALLICIEFMLTVLCRTLYIAGLTLNKALHFGITGPTFA